MTTQYREVVTIRDGYYGGTQLLHLCEDTDGRIYGVYSMGYIIFADPSQGIPPLPKMTGVPGKCGYCANVRGQALHN